ncbi:MAG: hypothetical protein ACYSX0_15450 [Planctomycetota bacterium]|jgi:hypothetical protein
MKFLQAAFVLGCAVALSLTGCSAGEDESASESSLVKLEVIRLGAKIDALKEELAEMRDELRQVTAGHAELRARMAEQRGLIESLLFPPDGPPEPPVPDPPPDPPRQSRWDPPADLPHLEDTPVELRARIDKLISIMFDPYAGADSLDAREALVVIGQPAFPRILGRMAKARDEITDVDSHEERLYESSLKLADEALRGMDGWLNAKSKPTLRPGSKKDYIQYICRLHYKRWEQKLKNLDEMPGPFDPSKQYEED